MGCVNWVEVGGLSEDPQGGANHGSQVNGEHSFVSSYAGGEL